MSAITIKLSNCFSCGVPCCQVTSRKETTEGELLNLIWSLSVFEYILVKVQEGVVNLGYWTRDKYLKTMQLDNERTNITY